MTAKEFKMSIALNEANAEIEKLKARLEEMEDGLKDLRVYLVSEKFENDTTVQVKDVLSFLRNIYR